MILLSYCWLLDCFDVFSVFCFFWFDLGSFGLLLFIRRISHYRFNERYVFDIISLSLLVNFGTLPVIVGASL